MKYELANDFSATHPDNVQIISKRCIDFDLLFDRVFQNCDIIVWRAIL